MKRTMAMITLIVVFILTFTGCGGDGKDKSNFQSILNEGNCNKAIIRMPNDEIVTVDVDKWSKVTRCEAMIIEAKDGTIYVVDLKNCILINEGETK